MAGASGRRLLLIAPPPASPTPSSPSPAEPAPSPPPLETAPAETGARSSAAASPRHNRRTSAASPSAPQPHAARVHPPAPNSQGEQADEEKIHVERACARHDAGKPSVAQMTGCRITASAISPGLRNANAASRCASRASLVASGVSGASAGSSGGIGCSRTANRVRTAATNQDQVCTLYQDGAIVRLPGNLRTGKTCQIRQFLAAIDRLAVNMAGSPETPPLPTVAKPHPDYFCTPGRIHPSRARANRGILPSL